jgi:hypothetical protein
MRQADAYGDLFVSITKFMPGLMVLEDRRAPLCGCSFSTQDTSAAKKYREAGKPLNWKFPWRSHTHSRYSLVHPL